jgi:hypothetical protein
MYILTFNEIFFEISFILNYSDVSRLRVQQSRLLLLQKQIRYVYYGIFANILANTSILNYSEISRLRVRQSRPPVEQKLIRYGISKFY